MSLQCRFAPDPEAAASARQALEAFRGHLEDDLIASSALVATELVTNSVKHSEETDRPIDLSVTADTRRVRVEVTDHGAGFEPRVDPGEPERESGWGLFLVDQLSDRWGVDRRHSFSVWAELGRRAAAASV